MQGLFGDVKKDPLFGKYPYNYYLIFGLSSFLFFSSLTALRTLNGLRILWCLLKQIDN